ncbi:hypothetical protein AA23498_0734 [Acetobacter nitrogenifigens DSM 23921 = NBRC 105050]|uniref:Toxin CcdB n=1 Tax=Acetobacter nitrogenifigens DSM 23921 = NBRC 105050 TaxID=1120919 RepID=A0A511XDD1_9PROT|nr:CcdB family protein [Acetobacter nitrogenifigens]GBQ89888.1 hypothetical protein AA23498_0734 [Acetobacter nitrogenifigens DSM 23921 = NBRC 105050]GEN60960.1 CcdB cytotoxin-like protein [Acetobacter nitrogenifigens DSM 23921 = NBRC 105050]
MPQFAIYPNPGRNRDILFVVQVQSSRLDRSVGRVVIPLVRLTPGAPPDHALTPHMTVEGKAVFANPFDLATVPANRLGPLLGFVIESERDALLHAIDELVSRA